MLSVLIPIYNYKVTSLVTIIHNQLSSLNIDFEIICIDDASTICFNENDAIKKLKNVTFIKLKKNIGRSKIRNLLALKSKYDWFLFLDVDVLPKNNNFIQKYVRSIKSNNNDVYVGGISYTNKKPENDKLLRWIYGKKREEVSFSKRRNKPYNYFFGGNFLIYKSIFDSIKFNESIVKYGYEDLLFAENMEGNKIKLIQIDNPVIHLGVTLTDEYLISIKHSIENLNELNKEGFQLKNSKILKVFKFTDKIGLTLILSKVYLNLSGVLEKKIKSSYPKLVILDFYKLTYLSYLKKIS